MFRSYSVSFACSVCFVCVICSVYIETNYRILNHTNVVIDYNLGGMGRTLALEALANDISLVIRRLAA